MSHDSRVLGTFGMYYREVRHPEPSDIALIQYASSIAGIAIERERSQIELAKAFEEVKTSGRQLQQTVDAIPQTIVVLGSDVTMNARLTDGTTSRDLVLQQAEIVPQT